MPSSDKKLGDNNLAPDRTVDTLTGVLKVTRWIMAVLLLTLIASAIFGSDAALTLGSDPLDPDAEGRTAYLGVAFDENSTRAGVMAASLEAIIFSIFGIYAITQILNILNNVSAGAPFAFDNGTYLRRIGFAGAAAQLGVYALWIACGIIALTTGVSFTGLSIQITPTPWIGVMIAFALSTIFRQGAAMKQEQDLTV